MENYLFAGGQFHKLDTENMKAITTVPGWAENFMRQQRRTPAATRYMQSPTANTCVIRRAQALSAIPWDLQTGEDTFAPDKHPLRLLLEEVNPDVNWIDLIRATEADLLIYGAAYWLKVGEGRTFFLQRLNPADAMDACWRFICSAR